MKAISAKVSGGWIKRTGGPSINGYYYGEAALQGIAKLLENAHAYVDHARSEADTQVRSVRDMVGFYHSAQYVPPGNGDNGHVDATLHILESSEWLWSMICEACVLGHPELIGLSIDIYGIWQPLNTQPGKPLQAQAKNASMGKLPAQPLKEVTRVVALNSCDIVTRPSAGGAFQHILQSLRAQHQPAASTIPQAGELFMSEMNGLNGQIQNDGRNSALMDSGQLADGQGGAATGTRVHEDSQSLLEALRLERAQLMLERRLYEVRLPEPIKEQIRARYRGRMFEMAALEDDLSASRKMMADLTASGLIQGHNYERPEIGAQITEAEKIQAAFDGMFGLEIETSRVGNVRGFTSIREAYARVTGDPAVNGLSSHSTVGNIRVSESAPMSRIMEADTTTATFSYLLGTSMNKRLLKDYQAWPAEWQKFCSIVPIRDFKQQTRVRLGAFGSLTTVAEDTPYSTISLADSAATYVPQKRGNLVTISRETIVNDDLHAIKQIPTKLAVSAAYTLAEFVYAFLSGNPTIYDGSALFTTGAPHSNLGASALSTAAMQTGITAMREQTNFAGKRIGLRPRFLVVPPELEWSSMVVTKSAGVPGSANNDINPMLGYVTPVVSPQLSSATQWFMIADPREVDTIEIGFVGGQVNPALFIQDMPIVGLNFTQDVISYKIRHEYGGAIVDYRGLYRGI